jgi:EmrB/QacA subfamily drug resistance transporter
MSSNGTPSQHPRRWLVLLAMTGSLSMIFVDITVTGVAGPAIGRDFASGPDGVSWIANAYILALAALMAIGGRLGDIVGRRNAFVAGVAVFAAASAVCGMAGDLSWLLVGRVLQGVGAALMQPASSSIVIDSFDPGERGKAMGVYIGIPMTFFALGPVLGGLMTEHVGWRSVFFVNLPIAAAAIALALYARSANLRAADRSFDLLSAVLLVLGLPGIVFALQDGAKAPEPGAVSALGDSAPLRILTAPILATFAAGLVLCTLFVVRQFRAERPLLRLSLFQDRALLADATLIAIMQFAMAGIIVEGSIYAQEVLGYAPARAGASLMPMLVPVIFLARRAGGLYDRHGVRPLARFGTSLAALGFCVWAAGCVVERYAVIAAGMVLLGAGVAFIMSPANTDALSRAPAEMRGQVSGLLQTFRQLGGALGVAFAACIVDAVRAAGQPLSAAIGAAMFGGAVVAALGAVVALRMPAGAPRARQ